LILDQRACVQNCMVGACDWHTKRKPVSHSFRWYNRMQNLHHFSSLL